MADGLVARDFKVSLFVKFEQLKSSKVNRAPRIIQFPSFKHILWFLRFIKPIESQFPTIHDFTGTTMFFKGMDLKRRAEAILAKWSCFDDPVVFCIDCTAFDANVLPCLLQVKHFFYRLIINDETFHANMRKELKTKARSRLGLRVQYDGNVRSGSADTGCGNSVMMVIMIKHAMETLGIAKYAVADDGDDAHIYVERAYKTTMQTSLVAQFASYGHELKLEEVAESVHEIDFCQCRLVHTVAGPVMVRDPRKVLSHALCTNKFVTPTAMKRFTRAVGECELSLNRGVPVLQSYALALLRNTPNVRPLPLWELEAYRYRRWNDSHLGPLYVSQEARASFAVSFGIPEQEQLRIEARLDQWVLDFSMPEVSGEDLSPMSWVPSYGTETLFI